MTNDFKTTGEYNQVKSKVKHMLDIASGHNPVPNFMLLDTEGTWIFVLPMNDAAKTGTNLNTFGVITTSDISEISSLLRCIKAINNFGIWHISRLKIIDMIQFKVSTKMEKEKASEKIADFIFDLG